jgi:hypothetical protein
MGGRSFCNKVPRVPSDMDGLHHRGRMSEEKGRIREDFLEEAACKQRHRYIQGRLCLEYGTSSLSMGSGL